MKRALLPALIASLFAVNGSAAAERELLFGPSGVVDEAAPAKPRAARPAQPKPQAIPSHDAPAPAPVARTSAPPAATAPAPSSVPAAAPPLAAKAPPVAVPPVPAAPVAAVVAPRPVAAPVVTALPAMAAPRFNALTEEDIDPVTARERLLPRARQQVAFGFFPSTASGIDQFNFLRNFLPLANHLTSKTGVLVNLIPERDPQAFERRIAEARYPILYLSPSQTGHALAAEYRPVVSVRDQASAVLVVPTASKVNALQDMSGLRVTWSRQSQATYVAMTEIAAAGLADKNVFVDVGKAGRDREIEMLSAGATDVAVMAASDAELSVRNSAGKLRAVAMKATVPVATVWVRKDLGDGGFVSRLQAAFLAVAPDAAEASAKGAARAFAKGVGARGQFVGADMAATKAFAAELAQAQSAFPDYFEPPEFDAAVRDANLSRPALIDFEVSAADTSAEARSRLVAQLANQTNVGFFPGATATNDQFNFLRNFLPLANYLSTSTGVLTNLVPERNLRAYAQRIAEQRYPIIFVNAALAKDAADADYVPLAVSEDQLAPAFIVATGSKFKSIDDVKGARVAWSRNAQTTVLAMRDLASRKLAGSNTYEDAGLSATAAVARVAAGTADVAIVRASVAEQTVARSGGKLRVLQVGSAAPATTAWVRKSLLQTDFARLFKATLLGLRDANSNDAREVARGFSRGYGVGATFVEPDGPRVSDLVALNVEAREAFPEFFEQVVPDDAAKDANMAAPAIVPNANFKAPARGQKVAARR